MPVGSCVVVSVATPATILAVPKLVVPLKKVTSPPGVLPVTVALSVIVAPRGALAGLAVSVVVEAVKAAVTSSVRAVEALAALLASPA